MPTVKRPMNAGQRNPDLASGRTHSAKNSNPGPLLYGVATTMDNLPGCKIFLQAHFLSSAIS